MLINYLKIAFRNAIKYKAYTLITIFGLTLGLTCFILSLMFVQFEFSYDKFFPESDRMARIAVYFESGTEQFNTSAPLASKLKTDIAGIEETTSIDYVNAVFSNKSGAVEERGLSALDGFFEIFSHEWIYGSPEGTLEDPNSIIISENLSNKLFGNINPLNEPLEVRIWGGEKEIKTIRGVVKKLPYNTHLRDFDFIIPVISFEWYIRNLDQWSNRNYNTYVLTSENTTTEQLNVSLEALSAYILKEDEYYSTRPENLPYFKLQPIAEAHLFSGGYTWVEDKPGSLTIVYLISGIGILILLLSIVNYINLSTARYTVRAKEIGVRKSLGSQRKQVIIQFLAEVAYQTVLAMLISIFLAKALLPYFADLVGREISSSLLLSPEFIVLALITLVATSFLAGGYPALFLSSLEPVKILKGNIKKGNSKSFLRNGLVLIQFVVTLSLLSCTLVVVKQLNFIHSQDTGVARDGIVAIEIQDRTLSSDFEILKQRFSKLAYVSEISASNQFFINMNGSSHVALGTGQKVNPDNDYTILPAFVAGNVVELFDLELIAGNSLADKNPATNAALINEQALKSFGRDLVDIMGEEMYFWGEYYTIAGVVKDFQYSSSYNQIKPLVMVSPKEGVNNRLRFIYAKVNSNNTGEVLNQLETAYNNLAPGFPFQYYFMDDYYQRLYGKETKLKTAISFGSLIALIISCLGILGLALFTISQRYKEIGVRKVLGATTSHMLKVFNTGYVKIMAVSLILSVPVSVYFLNKWLAQFAYRINLGAESFIISGLVVFLCAILTVSWQVIKVAKMNPVKLIRSE